LNPPHASACSNSRTQIFTSFCYCNSSTWEVWG